VLALMLCCTGIAFDIVLLTLSCICYRMRRTGATAEHACCQMLEFLTCIHASHVADQMRYHELCLACTSSYTDVVPWDCCAGQYNPQCTLCACEVYIPTAPFPPCTSWQPPSCAARPFCNA
jgi:hypothetical protein